MESLLKYVKSVLWRLRLEKSVRQLQAGLFAAAATALLILAVSRLFVVAHYVKIAAIASAVVLIIAFIMLFLKRVQRIDAIRQLDAYMPDNLLLTALTVKKEETHLAPALVQSAKLKVANAFELFQKREKQYVNLKMLVALGITSSLLAVLILFPSEAQQEAESIVKEKEIVEELKKDVKELAKQEPLPETKKELESLVQKLSQLKTSEETLREVIKKQKELKLKERGLAEKKAVADSTGNPEDQLTEEELKQLAALSQLSDELARNVGNTQTALNKIGKAPSLPALANAKPSSGNSTSDGEGNQSPSGEAGEADGAEDGTGQDGEQSSQAGTGDSKSTGAGQTGQGQNQGQASGQGQGQGSGQGQNPGQGTGAGQGSGTGQGQGQGSGQGTGMGGLGSGSGAGPGGGSGAGIGSGGRTLLSIPFKRVGGKVDPSVVKGQHGKGDFIEERETEGPVEKGTIRPYREVIGEYKESYLQSTDRMQLPPDLQNVLSDYFSSIE